MNCKFHFCTIIFENIAILQNFIHFKFGNLFSGAILKSTHTHTHTYTENWDRKEERERVKIQESIIKDHGII